MQEPTEMDIPAPSSVTAADAARSAAGARTQRRTAAAGFGAVLDAALTRPDSTTRAQQKRDSEREIDRDREDEDRIAAAQQSAWFAAREARAAERRPQVAGADRFDRSPDDTRLDAARERAEHGRASSPPPTGAPVAAVAAARSIEAARARADSAESAAVDAAKESHTAERHSADRAAASTDDVRAREADGAPSVHDVERSMDALAPQFRTRLERVIARMEAEGHDVSVAETRRDAARQDHLYEQGRSRPGPVVTWTRNSNHMRGMAADLLVDGSYDNPAGYARLARIAAEEGLQTLGARDAGHVELRTSPPLVRTATAAQAAVQQQPIESASAQQFGVPQVAAVAQVAGVAQVSGVAQVAQVAAVAAVAQPGSYSPIAQPAIVDRSAIAAADAQVANPAPAELSVQGALQVAAGTVDAAHAEARRPDDVTAGSNALSAAREVARSLAARVVASLGGRGAKSGDATGEGAGSVATPAQAAAASGAESANSETVPFVLQGASSSQGVQSGAAAGVQRADVAGRMERVQALQDAALAQPLSHVTLRVDGEDGSAARINIGLRGNTVGATIDTADPLAAASMRAHVAELRQALERQGLDTSALLVRAAARLPEGNEAGKLAAALTSADLLASLAPAAGRESAAQREQNARDQQHTATRRDPDAQRQRQNRNNKEDRP